MSNKNISKSKRKPMGLLAVLVCLVVGIFGASTSFATTDAFPGKGWDRLVGGGGNDTLQGIVATADGGTVSVGNIGDDAVILKTDERGTNVWKTQIGGSGTDSFNSVVQLPDGSFLAAGSSTSSRSGDIDDYNDGGSDGWIVKLDKDGTMLWNQLVGGDKNDGYQELILTSDGGFLAVGNSFSSATGGIMDTNNKTDGATSDGYIAKFDKDGELEWDNLFGSNQSEHFFDVIQTGDGGFVAVGKAAISLVVGGTYAFEGEITDQGWGALPDDALMVKFDAGGNPIWHNLFGSYGRDAFYSIVAASDGGFVAAGTNGSLDGDITTGDDSEYATALVAKFDVNGGSLWNRACSGDGASSFQDIMADPTGGYLTVGQIYMPAPTTQSTNNGLVTKINGTGSVEASVQIGGNGDDALHGITMDASGHIVVTGTSDTTGGGDILSAPHGLSDGLLAYYGETLYNITFDENGGTVVPDQFVAFGDVIADPGATTRTGYIFAGWYTDPTCSQLFSASSPILGDTTLYAKWTEIRSTVTFDPQGGTNVDNQIVAYGKNVVEPASPTRKGYTFAGWCTDVACTNAWDFAADGVYEDITLYAKWSVNQYRVVFSSRGGSEVGSITADFDTTIAAPASPAKKGYIFAGWFKDSLCLNEWIFQSDKLSGDMTLYAKWTPVTYTIEFRGNGATSGTMASMPMTYNTTKTLTKNAFKVQGHSFLGWGTTSTGPVVYKNLAAVTNLTDTNNKTIILYAKWGSSISTVTSTGYNKIKVTWAYAGYATSYKIYRATSPYGKFSLVYRAGSTARSWTNTGLVTGKTYYYKVYPVSGGQTFAFSKYKYAKPVPAAPVVALSKASSTSIRVKWTGVAGATKYLVYRSTSASGRYSLVYTASSTARTWTNKGLKAGRTYYYKIRAYHLEGKTKIYGNLSVVKSYRL